MALRAMVLRAMALRDFSARNSRAKQKGARLLSKGLDLNRFGGDWAPKWIRS